MAITAMTVAIAGPMVKNGAGAVDEYQALQSAHNLSLAVGNYVVDNDDTFPLGLNQNEDKSLDTWFGHVDAKGKVDPTRGSLSEYLGSHFRGDPSAPKLDYLGNHTGFGYNYQTLGSDLTEPNPKSGWPNCANAASLNQLSNPSGTAGMATSVYFRAPWQKNGDGQAYDFGFINPPHEWNGNPTVDFRHRGTRQVDAESKSVLSNGFAIVIFADGSSKLLKQSQVQEGMFRR